MLSKWDKPATTQRQEQDKPLTKVVSIRLISEDGETILDSADIESPQFSYNYNLGVELYKTKNKLSSENAELAKYSHPHLTERLHKIPKGHSLVGFNGLMHANEYFTKLGIITSQEL